MRDGRVDERTQPLCLGLELAVTQGCQPVVPAPRVVIGGIRGLRSLTNQPARDELVQRAVQRAGAELDAAVRGLLDLLDDPEAVPWLVGQGQQDQERRPWKTVVERAHIEMDDILYVDSCRATQSIRTRGVVFVEARLQGPGSGRNEAVARSTRLGALLDRIREIPGVDAAALVSGQLLVGGGESTPFARPKEALRQVRVHALAVTADYFRMLQPELVAGRLATQSELATNTPVLVVSERVEHDYWPRESPYEASMGTGITTSSWRRTGKLSA